MRATPRHSAGRAITPIAYLNIQRIRMGRRLAFEFDIPAELRGAASRR